MVFLGLIVLHTILMVSLGSQAKDWFVEGNQAYASGHLLEAKEAYLNAKRASPDNADIRVNLASVLLDIGDSAASELEYLEALSLDGQHTSGLFNLAMLLQDQHRFEEAQKHYEALVAISPHDIDAWANLATVLHQSGTLSEAVVAYKNTAHLLSQVLQKQEKQSSGTDMGASTEEEEHLVEMLSTVFENLGRVLFRMVDLTPARGVQDSEADGGNQNAYGSEKEDTTKTRRQLKTEAIQAFSAALRLHPDRPIAAHMLAALSGGEQTKGDTAPERYVTDLFDDYSENFDESLQALHYIVPALIGERVRQLGETGVHFTLALDLGCGTGLLGEALREHAVVVLGVDLSSGMLSKAERRGWYDGLFRGDMTIFLSGVWGMLTRHKGLPERRKGVRRGTDKAGDLPAPEFSADASMAMTGEVEEYEEEDEEGDIRRKMHGSSVREVEDSLPDWHAPALAAVLSEQQPTTDVDDISLPPGDGDLGPNENENENGKQLQLQRIHTLVVAADVFVYVGDLQQVFEATAAILRPSESSWESQAQTQMGIFIFTVELLGDAEADDSSATWRLQESGRFSHAEGYIRKLAAAVQARTVDITPIVPRTENGKRILGLLVEVHF